MWASRGLLKLKNKENLKYNKTKNEMIDSVSLFLGWLNLKAASRVSHVTKSLSLSCGNKGVVL